MKPALGLEARVVSQVGNVPSAIGTFPVVVHAGNQAAQMPVRSAAFITKRDEKRTWAPPLCRLRLKGKLGMSGCPTSQALRASPGYAEGGETGAVSYTHLRAHET